MAQLRAGVYGRESKDKMKSIDDQIAENRAAVEEHRWRLVAEYTDGVSASRFGRKPRRGWKRLLADLEAGELDVVVVWEPSRGDRDLSSWLVFIAKCRDLGVLIHTTGDGDSYDPRKASHWERLATAGVRAASESNITSERVLKGVRHAAANGQPHGRVPYGYERILTGEERATPHGPKPIKRQQPDPDTCPIVVEIFERVARNDPLVAIVRDLNERAVPAPIGARWQRNTIRKIVKSEAYIGRRVHNGDRHEAVWPALVTEGEFRDANRVLDDPKRRTSKPGKMRWLLSYIAVGECGGPLRAQPGPRARYTCLNDGCVAAGVEELDEFITLVVLARLSKPDVRDLFVGDDDATVAAARTELAALKAKLAEAEDSFAKIDGTGISAATLARAERNLKPRIEAAEKCSISAAMPAALAELLGDEEFEAETARPRWEALPVAARREIITVLFAEIRLGKPTVRLSRWSSTEDRLDAVAERVEVTPRTAGNS